MSGRAGRRGFDPVGNVVFFGVPYQKVQRLITANIPKLVGNFPINVSLVLRLLLMTSKGDDKRDALTKVSTGTVVCYMLQPKNRSHWIIVDWETGYETLSSMFSKLTTVVLQFIPLAWVGSECAHSFFLNVHTTAEYPNRNRCYWWIVPPHFKI